MMSAFRPGQAGGTAIGNLISGAASPSGKLGQSWVRSAGQAMSGAAPFLQWRVGKWLANSRSPPDPDGRVYDPYNTHAGVHPTMRMVSFAGGKDLSDELGAGGSTEAEPLFRFGDCLSYTNFSFANVTVSAPNPEAEIVATLSVELSNTGERTGTEVVQVYATLLQQQCCNRWMILKSLRCCLDPDTVRTR